MREIHSRLVCSLLLAMSVLAATKPLTAGETALDRYIAKPDASYAWKLLSQTAEPGQTTFVISLTSQTWRSADEVDRPLWTHQLTVVRPDGARPGTAFLFIGGGSHRDGGEPRVNPRNASLATGTKTVVAELSVVPDVLPFQWEQAKNKPRG